MTPRWLCRTALALGLGCSISLGCSPGQTTVTRIVDSELVRGRYISPEAYASYARGAYLEAQGDLTRALQAFSEAARRDPENANAWVRRGAVLCALRQRALSALTTAMKTARSWGAPLQAWPGWST